MNQLYKNLSTKDLKRLYRLRTQVWLQYGHDLTYWYKRTSKYGKLIIKKQEIAFKQLEAINAELFDRRVFK